jgi:3-dehydroquinate synthase class II
MVKRTDAGGRRREADAGSEGITKSPLMMIKLQGWYQSGTTSILLNARCVKTSPAGDNTKIVIS